MKKHIYRAVNVKRMNVSKLAEAVKGERLPPVPFSLPAEESHGCY